LEHIKVPILFVGEHWFQDVFHEAARDLLSMRSISLGLYTSNEDPGTLTPTEQRSRSHFGPSEAFGRPKRPRATTSGTSRANSGRLPTGWTIGFS
jgi:hypothetical protein